jgi:hypothetical protein
VFIRPIRDSLCEAVLFLLLKGTGLAIPFEVSRSWLGQGTRGSFDSFVSPYGKMPDINESIEIIENLNLTWSQAQKKSAANFNLAYYTKLLQVPLYISISDLDT